MAHGIEADDTIMIGGTVNNELMPAWHGLGNEIPQHVVTSADALIESGLNWEIEQRDIFASNEIEDPENPNEMIPSNIWVPDMFANVRTSDDKVLGVVGDRYQIIQNHEAFKFCDDLVDSGEAKFHTAGSLFGGKQVFMLMKVADDIIIGGMEDEKMERFILFHHAHDGSAQVRVTPTVVRVVCNNTVRAAQEGAKNEWKFRHTSNIDGRLSEARAAIGISFGYFDAVADMGNNLVAQAFSDADFLNLMDQLMPLPVEGEGKGSKIAYSRVNNRREALHEVYTTADNLNNIRGTKWGAYQSVIEFRDHHSEQREQKNDKAEVRFNRIIGGKDEMIIKTQQLLTV